MNKEHITEQVYQILRDIFDDEGLVLSPQTTSRDVAGWDSLKHIILVSVLEKHFNIKFALGEIESLKDVGDLLATVYGKCAE